MGLSLSIQKRLLENLVSCSYFIVPQESKILIITKQMYQGSYRFNLQSFANFWLLVWSEMLFERIYIYNVASSCLAVCYHLSQKNYINHFSM